MSHENHVDCRRCQPRGPARCRRTCDGASLVRRRVRREQADQADRDRDEDRVDESSLLLLRRRQERGDRQDRQLALELGNPNALLRNGWTPNSVKIGEEVTVEGTRAKDGTLLGNARSMTLASTGQRLFAGSSQTTNP